MRLAKPKVDEASTSRTAGESGTDAGSVGGGGGSGGTNTRGAGSGNGPTTGTHELGGGADVAVGEQELAFTLMTSLTDESKRDNVRLLLRNLANAIDEGKASYAQLMVKVIVDDSVADALAEDIRSTGTSPTVKKI
jgi:hypothetical protein